MLAIIMTVEDNNDGIIINWSFEVVLGGGCSLIFWWAVFIKLLATLSPAVFRWCFCIRVFLGISYYLGAAAFESIL